MTYFPSTTADNFSMFIRVLSFCLITFLSISVSNAEQLEQTIKPPFVTNNTVNGNYYFAHDELIRDVYITTPINGKFYFKIFTAQAPTHGAMTVQYYNEVEGVATFNKQGIGIFVRPDNNCNLSFFFKPSHLVIEQEKNCGMASELGLEARGNYTQLESF